MIKQFLSALALLCIGGVAVAQTPTWMRYPSISPDGQTIVFTHKGDLYRVASSGGNAVQLTQHDAHDYMPVWSPDSKHIAFASDRYGNFDIFIMPVSGGEARRLTFHSANESPFSFTPDGKHLLFGASRMDLPTNRMYPTGSLPELYTVPVAGGRIEQILSTPADEAAYSKNGNFILYQDNKGRENPWRKHQTSSVTRDVWLYDVKADKHTRLTSYVGDDRNPVFADNDQTVFYLSEQSGTLNVHKLSVANPAQTQQVTTFKTHPVRFLSITGNGTLCFGHDGQIYTMAPGGQPAKLTINIVGDSKSNAESIVQVSSGAGGMAVAQSNKEIAFLNRGDVFVTSVEGSFTKRVTATPEIEKVVGFTPDGRGLIYASERNGKWDIYKSEIARAEEPYFSSATLIKESKVLDNQHENYQPVLSPDGKEMAYIENRVNLKIYNFDTKQSRQVVGPEHIAAWSDNDQYFTWSPDGKWLLFDMSLSGIAPGEVGIVAADGKAKPVNLTMSGFSDGSAKWIMDGKAMLWFSNRDGLKGVAQAGGSQSDVYAMFFSKDAWEKFNLSKDEAALLKDIEEKQAKADSSKKADAAKKDIVIEWDGLSDRKARLTIHSSSLSDALVSKDGENLYYLSRFERGHNLWTTNLRTRETKILATLNASGGSMVWDKDQKTIFLASGGTLSKIDPNSGRRDMISFSAEVALDRPTEMQSMFDQVWNKTKKTFYKRDFHGANWDGLRTEYAKYLPGIGNNYEFSEMLAELLGELNVSHSGSTYGGPGGPAADATAQLGIFPDYKHRGNGVRILEVIKDGPLDKSGMNVKAGAIVERVDGELITPDMDIDRLMNRKAGRNVLITLLEGDKRRDLVVKPITLGAQNTLLYKRWVEANRAEVEKASNGQLGYIHIPGMNDGSYRTTFEEALGRYAHSKALVIDTRFNGGGDLVADLDMFLSGRYFFDYANDAQSVGYEPNFRWTKPSISLVNEANYSDGHCYAYMYQHQGIGKLVGQPVPGTCTFAGWGVVGDGIRWGAPTIGVKDANGRYLENWQTEPDINVWNNFEVVTKGKDEQLEAAIKELMKEIQ